MAIFGEETIPAGLSPEDFGHDNDAAVDTGNQEAQDDTIHEDPDTGSESESEEADQGDSNSSPEEGHDEELLAGKYKSPEELVKAYREAQRKISEQGEQLRQLQGESQPPANQQQPPAAQHQGNGQQGKPSSDTEAFWKAFENNPLGTMQYLVETIVQQRTAPIFEEQHTNQLAKMLDPIAKEFPGIYGENGVEQLLDRVTEIAGEVGNINLAKHPTPRLLRLAAQELWGVSNAEQFKKAEAAGRRAAEEARRNKQGVQVNANTKPKSNEAPKTAEDEIADAILAYGRPGGLFGK